MLNCRYFKAFSFSCLVLFFAGCGNPSGLDSIQVTPATQSLTVGQTAQFTAVGTYGNANHPSTKNITSSGELDLQRSCRGNRQCFRGRNGCECGHNNDHSQRSGVQWCYYLQRNPRGYRYRRQAQLRGI